ERTVAMNRSPSLDFLLSISSSNRIFISVPRGIGRKRAADLCDAGLLLVWDCAAGINKAKQKTDTIKRAITLENFCIVFSFLMISQLFVQRTIRREKLNKQIQRVKVDCARLNQTAQDWYSDARITIQVSQYQPSAIY